MITIISGTNRKNSVSSEVAKAYSELLNEKGIANQIFDLEDLPNDFIFSALYGQVNEDFQQLTKKFIYDSSALVIISPEYNGSYPGVLKSFIDGWDRRLLSNQKVGLVGVASGRQGNSRGMDHLSAVMNYIGLTVVPSLVPISLINGLLNEDKKLTDLPTLEALGKQIQML